MISVILTLVVIGLLLWLVLKYIPMTPPIPTIIIAVAVICIVLWLLDIFGVLGYLNIPVPRIRR